MVAAHPESRRGAGSNFPYATEIVKKLNEEGKDRFDLKVEMAQASNISCYHMLRNCIYIINYIYVYILCIHLPAHDVFLTSVLMISVYTLFIHPY